MENLISVINRIQDTFTSLGMHCSVDLPQIAVVGEQSAGKSSVLENFVGRDFLPRGAGIVTRRPLILQLINQDGAEYAEFLHIPNKKFTDFLQVRREIEVETDRATGSNKNISPIPINLRVYSPKVLNLTLVDLPGLTKVPVGDQPADIEKQIKEMILTFITNPNSLILAVTPAIIDLANSEALRLAREVDPEGNRTIGVITKIDMMDKGTDCMDVLNNKTYFLKRGYIGIVNRCQRDIEGNINISEAQQAEMKFFSSHPTYRHLVGRVGSGYLQTNLNQQLTRHIKDTLPNLKSNITAKLSEIDAYIAENQDIFGVTDDPSIKTKILLEKLQDVAREVDTILGYQNETVDLSNLSAGFKINKMLSSLFLAELSKARASPDKIKKEIKIAIQNSQGVRQAIFSAGASFNAVIKQHITDTKEACLKMSDLVSSQMRDVIESVVSDKLRVYPNLVNEIIVFANEKINEFHRDARERIAFIVDIQVSHINTNHPDFVNVGSAEDSSESKAKPKNVAGMENITHKQGPMHLLNQGRLKQTKEAYFVLRGNALTWFKDSSKKEIKDQAALDNCKFQHYEKNQKYFITIYSKEDRNINKNTKFLELSCLTSEDHEAWKVALISAGVENEYLGPTNAVLEAKNEDLMNDVNLMKQVEYVYLLVDTYYRIVVKSEQDVVSKICVFCIILKVRNMIFSQIIGHLLSQGHLDQYMQESQECEKLRKDTLRLQKSCRDALTIINNFANSLPTDYSLKDVPPNSTSSMKPSRLAAAPKVDPKPSQPQPPQNYLNTSDFTSSSPQIYENKSSINENKSPKAVPPPSKQVSGSSFYVGLPQASSEMASNVNINQAAAAVSTASKILPVVNTAFGSDNNLFSGKGIPAPKKPNRPPPRP